MPYTTFDNISVSNNNWSFDFMSDILHAIVRYRVLVSNGMDSSSPNPHLRAKMTDEQATTVKMRRSTDEYYSRRS